MTVTDEGVDVQVEAEDDNAETNENESDGTGGRKKDRDFTKFREQHQELADFVNANSGLDPITPNHIKAVQALVSDFRETPEQAAKREEAKKRREADKAKYAGLSDEQVKAQKAADKVQKQADKLQERLNEALAKAQRIRNGEEATGTDVAAAVEASQNGHVEAEATPEVEPEAETPRRIGKRR